MSRHVFQHFVERQRAATSVWRKSLWQANVRMVTITRAGRVLLAADAAHAHSPARGPGRNI
jgi:2-polyprenyl-6-methoxyphenol hydroxylase-like FAD-dependent oxidoreductase